MKLAGNRVESFLKAPDAAAKAILLYGPDAGLIRERLDRLTRTVVSDLGDPFRVVDLFPASLKEDPARLADEAASLSMLGGRRVVRVRDAGDGLSGTLKSFLAHPIGDALVVIEAGELGPRSSLRKLAEEAENAVALACYGDEGAGLESVIHESLRAHGLTAEPDAVAWLADHLGGDRLMTRSELDKLALYMGPPEAGEARRVRLEDAAACVGDSASLSMDDLAMAAAEGDHEVAQRILDRLFQEGTSPIPILRGLQRYFQRLHLAAAAIAAGRTPDQAIALLKPPAHFRVAGRLRGQLSRWPAPRVGTALDLLVNAEIDGKTTGMPAEEICGRAVMQLCRAAGRPGAGRR